MLDLDCLRTFLSIAETASFTRTAHIVGRTQSAISMQIKRLEAIIGGKLFERQSGSLRLTSRGETLRDYAVQLLQVNEEALERVRGFELSGKVRLGVSDDFAEGPLGGILSTFRKAHSRVNLEITVSLTHELLDMLDNGRFDLVVAKKPSAGPERPCAVLNCVDLVWACAAQSAILDQEPLPIVSFPERAYPRDILIAALKKHGIRWHIAATCYSVAALRAAVAADWGISALARPAVLPPLRVASPHPRLPALPKCETALFWSSGRLGPAVHRLRKSVLAAFQ
ncbi:LysR substrate-binding domain-containing protein [Pseudorhodoplanes sp.]|uniref:LysR substrate-binding domain-containing protein n=1 Tax=Pseudorhodoplanes sp. TaxID=1934341 RepID=UPI003D11527C